MSDKDFETGIEYELKLETKRTEDLREISQRFPGAYRQSYLNGQHVWVHPDAWKHATEIAVFNTKTDMSGDTQVIVCPYVPVGNQRVYVLKQNCVPVYAALDTLKRDHPNAYLALVRGVSGQLGQVHG